MSSAWSSRTSSFGRHPRDLADQLRADRAAGAGDQHDLVLQVGADAVELHHDRLAAEHVLDLDLAQLPGQLDAAAQQLEDRRQGADVDVALAAGRDDPAAQLARRRGDRDHDLVGLRRRRGCGRSRSVVPSTLMPCRRMPALARVVVQEADRAVAQVRVELQLADDHLPARAGADDEHLSPLSSVAAAATGRSMIIRDEQPGAADEDRS